MDINPSPLQKILTEAVSGTIITTKELVKELSRDNLTDIKEGEMTVEDLHQIVLDLVESKNVGETTSMSDSSRVE